MYESNSKFKNPPSSREHDKRILEMKNLVEESKDKINPDRLPKYIKDAIKTYCVDKRQDLHDIIRRNLTNTDPKTSSMTPKAVKEAKDLYNLFVDRVNELFRVIDECVDPLNFIASEYMGMTSENLKEDLSWWHLTIFQKEIWAEHNISIILNHYKKGIEGEDKRVNEITENYQKLADVQKWKEHKVEEKTCCKYICSKCRCKITAGGKHCSPHKKGVFESEQPPITLNGQPLTEVTTEDLINFINNDKKNSN